MSEKLDFGSMSPVNVSTVSIWDFTRAVARSIRPSLGHLLSKLGLLWQ